LFQKVMHISEKKLRYFYKGIGNILYIKGIKLLRTKKEKKYFIKHFS
jgi:hypothetical protein